MFYLLEPRRALLCVVSCDLTRTRLPAVRGTSWDGAVLSDGSSVAAGTPVVGLGFSVDPPGPASCGRSRRWCQLTAASHRCVAWGAGNILKKVACSCFLSEAAEADLSGPGLVSGSAADSACELAQDDDLLAASALRLHRLFSKLFILVQSKGTKEKI